MKFLSLLQSAIVYGTIILYGAVGEILTQKSGNLNLGVPGLMSLGAVGGFIFARAYEVLYCGSAGISPVPILCVLVALLGALLFSGLGAACLELMFYISMYGELLMALFLYFYAMRKSKVAE